MYSRESGKVERLKGIFIFFKFHSCVRTGLIKIITLHIQNISSATGDVRSHDSLP
jgi:hypothetical protein